MRENLWQKHNKSANENDKSNILKDITFPTEKIENLQAYKNACNRIITRYTQIK